MSGLRLSLALPGATTADLLRVAPVAEHWNIAGLWVGDPRAGAPNGADSYVTAAAAALTAVTRDIRLGLFLRLSHEKQVVRIAEDVAVIDQASGGRVELAFVPSGAEWLARAAALLRSWNHWELPGSDETVPVIPGPAQPTLPRVVVGDPAGADALAGGRITFHDESAIADETLVPRRTVLVIEPDLAAGAAAWLAGGAFERVSELRAAAQAAGAQELMLLAPTDLSERDIEVLGTVLVPSLRAAGRDARAISTDAWVWITEKGHLHAPPQ
jgi:alkanesulfonate monooxygenase SsuD/methylene tetrahydromethanopterin reductase-like flavin-dependent oxidoreductase (luciferase family)